MKRFLHNVGTLAGLFWWLLVWFLVISVFIFGNTGGDGKPPPKCYDWQKSCASSS